MTTQRIFFLVLCLFLMCLAVAFVIFCPQEKGAFASGERRVSVTKRTTSQAVLLLLLVVVMLNVDAGRGSVDLRN